MGFAPSSMQLTSSAFTDGGNIPTLHTGDSEDLSPALSWNNPPAGTKSYAIICHDPDAPLVTPRGVYGFVHWVLYNIPASTTSLSEGESGFTQGKNNFDNLGYNGPLPPEGHGTHHYYFWVLALDTESKFEEGLELWDFLKAIEPNLLGMNRLVGTYKRD